VRKIGQDLRQVKKDAKAVTAAAAEEKRAAAEGVRKIGTEIGELGAEGKIQKVGVEQAAAEFEAARGLRVTAQRKREALNDLTPEIRDAINLEAEKIPLNTTEGLAIATALATVVGGVGAAATGNNAVAGALAVGAAATGLAGKRLLVRRQQKQFADEIKTIVSEILRDRSGGAASAIENKIVRANDIAAAQRVANQALARMGIKPGVGAVTANTIYNAYAEQPSPEKEAEPEAEAPAEAPVEKESSGKPYDIEAAIEARGAQNLAPLINAIYARESSSGANPAALKENAYGAKGALQITRATFEGLKKQGMISKDHSFDNQQDLVDASVVLIKDLAKRYDNDPAKIAAVYYSGPGAVVDGVIQVNRRPVGGGPTVGEYVSGIESYLSKGAGTPGKARGGVVYSPQEEMLLAKYASGGGVSRPTLPADRYAGYKQEGESDDRLIRFFEAAARELPTAIKQNATSNADLAAKYLKFKFGAMKPDEMMDVARALPEKLKGAAVAAMQAVKEAPRAVAEATPESAGRFAGQMVAGEMTDPFRLVKGASRPVMSEIDVYHGSPHRFPPTENNLLGEFDASKINTGEGAQAYGHGIYIAENPDVANDYRYSLSARRPDRVTLDGKPISTDTAKGRVIEKMGLVGKQSALQSIDDNIRFNENYAPDIANLYREIRKEIEVIDPKRVNVNRGNLYTADLPDEMVDRMLDWDKPLSEQSPSVLAALEKSKNKHIRAMLEYAKTPYTGVGIEGETKTLGEAYRGMSLSLSGRANAGSPKASKLLQQAGIPGIKYLDAGSRGQGGTGTRNFVVFPGEEKKLRIIERN